MRREHRLAVCVARSNVIRRPQFPVSAGAEEVRRQVLGLGSWVLGPGWSGPVGWGENRGWGALHPSVPILTPHFPTPVAEVPPPTHWRLPSLGWVSDDGQLSQAACAARMVSVKTYTSGKAYRALRIGRLAFDDRAGQRAPEDETHYRNELCGVDGPRSERRHCRPSASRKTLDRSPTGTERFSWATNCKSLSLNSSHTSCELWILSIRERRKQSEPY